MKKLLIILSTLALSGALQAQEQVAPDPAAEPPADEQSLLMPPQVKSGEVLEPEVTIIEQPDKTIEQYSINGHMYMVKVTPIAGPPYYLVDSDGDGELDVRSSDPTNIAIPQWVLFRW